MDREALTHEACRKRIISAYVGQLRCLDVDDAGVVGLDAGDVFYIVDDDQHDIVIVCKLGVFTTRWHLIIRSSKI